MKCVITTVVGMLGIFAFTSATEAGVTINVTEVGSDVVFTTTGSLDLTGATLELVGVSYAEGLIPGGNNWYIASGAGSPVDTYALTSVDLPFGTSITFFSDPSSVSGDDFLIWGASGGTPQVGVTVGYVSGSAINSEMVFSSTTIAALTLIPGNYTFAIPNDTIRLNIILLQDSDNDGIPDDEDACPDSDLSETVVIDGCDSGVANLLFEDGCTMADLIAECADGAVNHGQFVSCVARLTNEWNRAGLITGREEGRIQSCTARSDIPGDLDGDGAVGVADLVMLLGEWGPCRAHPHACPADLDLDDIVGITDLLILLGNWG